MRGIYLKNRIETLYRVLKWTESIISYLELLEKKAKRAIFPEHRVITHQLKSHEFSLCYDLTYQKASTNFH